MCATPALRERKPTVEIRAEIRSVLTLAAKKGEGLRARANGRTGDAYVGRRRLISNAASAASASTSAPSRTQPTLASPLMVS